MEAFQCLMFNTNFHMIVTARIKRMRPIIFPCHPRYVEVIDEKQSRFQIPSILKTASVFALGALALAGAEKYAPDTWRPSSIVGTYDARITSAVKAAELNQQARFDVWTAEVKVASDQNAEAYRAAMNATLANYQASYDRAKIYAEAATRMQGQYAQMRMNQVGAQSGAENGIINLVRMFGHGANALESGSGDQAIAYTETMSRDVSNRMTQAAMEGARIDVTGWDTNLPSPDAVRSELGRFRPVPIPPPPVLSEQPVTMGGN
jgi:hypothetical protein